HECPLGPIDVWRRSSTQVVTRSLRADEPRTAPANEIAVGITHRPAGPIATRALRRVGSAVSLVDDITRRRSVIRLAVGNRAANDGAADHAGSNTRADCATIATGVGGGRNAEGADRQSGRRR